MVNDTAAELARAIQENATENMPGGFLIYEATAEEKILYVNKTTLTMYACTTVEEFLAYVNGSFTGMIYHEDLASVKASINEQINNKKTDYDHVTYRIKRKDGKIRWVKDYGHLVRTKEYGNLFYVFLYDFTETKLAEEEIKRAEEALACEKTLNKAKNAFIFNLSHDIRTPMNAILGYISLARKHREEAARVEEHLNHADVAAKHLLTLLDELLELAELDAARIHPKRVEYTLAEVVNDAVLILKPEFTKKSIALSLSLAEGTNRVLVDAMRLSRALVHILSNAAKFTPEHGSVAITISKQATSESGYARFSIAVKDNGIGMTPEFLKKAFGAFEREATSTQSKHLGTGIGLTLTKRIMEVLGGSVDATSVYGEGATFTLSLPLKLCDQQEALSSLESTKSTNTDLTGKGRILVVEDIEINRMLAETVLTESGFDVDTVPDGCDAVDAVLSKPADYYQAVLMDIQMPIMNGYEATRAIRASGRPDLVTLPIIALSANARPEDKDASFASGMNAHVAKPFDVEGLITTLKKYTKQEADIV